MGDVPGSSTSIVRDARQDIPGASFLRSSLTALPFLPDSFDATICIEMLEHVPKLEEALREMWRTLRRGGTLLVIDKNLCALDPRTCLPVFLLKRLAERRGRLTYPRDFPFRERSFWPWGLASRLRRIFRHVEMRFLPEERAGNATRLYKLVPFLSYDVAWIARK